jgi:transketolase
MLPTRDRFILSKGHAAAILYATLANLNFFPKENLNNFCTDGKYMIGHVSKHVPGIELDSGSLGHSLSIGIGMALVIKEKVYVLCGDGEMNEGSIWEAIMFAGQHKIKNLTLIIDRNKLQAMGETNNIINQDSLVSRISTFNWDVSVVNGHNIPLLTDCMLKDRYFCRPHAIISDTIKGYPISFMSNKLEWHYKCPNKEEYNTILKELA